MNLPITKNISLEGYVWCMSIYVIINVVCHARWGLILKWLNSIHIDIQCILNFINNFTYNWNFTMNACMGILILMLCVYAEPYLNSPKLHKFDMIFFGKALYTRVYIYMLPIGSTSIVLNCWHVKERVKTDSETFPYTYMYGYYTQLKKMPILFYL